MDEQERHLIALSQPLYLKLRPHLLRPIPEDATFEEDFASILATITRDDVNDLLSWVNWRPRLVGAYLVGFKNWSEFSPTIERLLIRDELVFASVGYAFALARFAGPSASTALSAYLWNNFSGRCTDVSSIPHAIAALRWIDEQNGTNFYEQGIGDWQEKVESGRATLQGSLREESREHMRKVVAGVRVEKAEGELATLLKIALNVEPGLQTTD